MPRIQIITTCIVASCVAGIVLVCCLHNYKSKKESRGACQLRTLDSVIKYRAIKIRLNSLPEAEIINKATPNDSIAWALDKEIAFLDSSAACK